MSQGWPDHGRRSSPSTPFKLISAASTNATSVLATAGIVTSYYCGNTATTFRYVKLYDKASAPTVGTDTPVYVIAIPAQSAANVAFEYPLAFDLGIAFAIVTGMADSSTGAAAANEVSVSLGHQ